MRMNFLLLCLVALVIFSAGCTSQQQQPGSREFIPGRGWVPN